MPNRRISNQSFDEILSDLGDDPAIPDPHGIRKSSQHNSLPNGSKTLGEKPSFPDSLKNGQIQNLSQKLGGTAAIICLILAISFGLFFTFNTLFNKPSIPQDDTQKFILDLKRDIALLRDELSQDQNDIYSAIDNLEVSIHLLNKKSHETKSINKPKALPQESELRRWRYLGTAQMGQFHKAFLDTGKGLLTLEKGAQILGEWHLSNIEKEVITFTHPSGKSLILKASKKE